MENIPCFLCFQSIKDNNTIELDPKFSDRRYKEKLFHCCSRLLGVKIEKSCNLKYSAISCSPFCFNCFESSEKLLQIEYQIETSKTKDDLENYIAKFTSDILRFRLAVFAKEIDFESEDNDDIDDEYTYQSSCGFQSNDLRSSLPTPNIAPSSSLLVINSIGVKDEAVKDELIIDEYFEEDDCGDSTAFPTMSIPELRVVLERLQFDSNGKVILPLESFTKRKAAIVARSSLLQNVSEDNPLQISCFSDGDPEFISGDLEFDSDEYEDNSGSPDVSHEYRKTNLKTSKNNSNSITKTKPSRLKRKYHRNVTKKYCFKKPCVEKRQVFTFMRKERKKLKCSICSESYNLTWDLDCHSNESGHVNERNCKCSLCGKSYYNQDDLKWHQRVCTYSNRRCKHCAKILIFPSISKYRLHIENHKKRSEAQLKSKRCIPNRNRLEYSNKYKCAVCSSLFSAIKAFHAHAKKEGHVNTPLFSCEKCHKKFYRPMDVKRHDHYIHQTILQACKICNKEFTTRIMYHSHKMWHKTKEDGQGMSVFEEPRKCDLCDGVFYGTAKLTRHKKKHEKGYPFQCNICFLLYKTEKTLSNHMESHQGVTTKRTIECDSCDQKFSLLSEFIAHKITDHGFHSPFICKHCRESFKSRRELNTHLKNVHSENPNNQKFNENCEFCGKLYKTHTSLQLHTLTHLNIPKESMTKIKSKSKERGSHQCAQCGKIFFYSHGLTDHWNKMHSPDALKNRVTCNICGKVLANQRYFIKHMSIHEKKFICEICGRGFSENYSLQGHIKRIHEQNKTPRKSYTRTMYPKPRCDKVSYIDPNIVF